MRMVNSIRVHGFALTPKYFCLINFVNILLQIYQVSTIGTDAV